ncbi:MAG: MotA/TolQ/ExbB proton channel family protein [Verrucomicrobiota bacterium]
MAKVAAETVNLPGWLKVFGLLALATLLGMVSGRLLEVDPVSLLAGLQSVLGQLWQAFGVALIGLLPLSLWLLRLVMRHVLDQAQADAPVMLDLAFIARNGPLLGLLGTVVALASAGATLASEVESGSTAAVLGVIPLVGQALFSTIAGIILAVAADTTLHVIERKHSETTEDA